MAVAQCKMIEAEYLAGAGGFKLRDDQLSVQWLGQAGFAIRHGSRAIFIDPYLSDHLATKYAGTEFPHIRMMPPPIRADEVRGLDCCLCTHQHSDHMDPDTLPRLAVANPACRFIVPRAWERRVAALEISTDRIVGLDAGETITINEDTTVTAIAAAHEELAVNERGEHLYLGYVLRCGGFVLYHSGDCVPYAGLAESLGKFGIQIMLLPVNGRDPRLTAKGIAGNFTLDEAMALWQTIGAAHLIVHHFGMFAFNTADPEALRARIRGLKLQNRCWVSEPGQTLVFNAHT